jgi:hypothetical protein
MCSQFVMRHVLQLYDCKMLSVTCKQTKAELAA